MTDDDLNSTGPWLLAIRFSESLKAQECLLATARLAKSGVIAMEDTAIVHNIEGKIRLQQTRDLNAAQGAGGGAWVGSLVGIIGGPPGMLAGGALGAAVGGLWAKLRDVGIDDDHMKGMGEELVEGEAALFLLITKYDLRGLAKELRRFDGTVLESTMSDAANGLITEELATRI